MRSICSILTIFLASSLCALGNINPHYLVVNPGQDNESCSDPLSGPHCSCWENIGATDLDYCDPPRPGSNHFGCFTDSECERSSEEGNPPDH